MEFEEFKSIMEENLKQINIEKFNAEMIMSFYKYMDLLIEWNKKINLTAIVEPKEIILKHFIDSLTISKYIDEGMKLIDIGTGAGFPGIPLSIVNNNNIEYDLVDSLNKRIIFLEEVFNQLKLKNIRAFHSRAEDFIKGKREEYDIAVSRAVAPLRILVEYLLPYVKIGGKCICMKGSNYEEELENAKNAIKILGGQIDKVEQIILPGTEIKRNLIIISKINKSGNKYPRSAGMPKKNPL